MAFERRFVDRARCNRAADRFDAAAALAQQVFGDLEGRRVLLVGAGRIGELAAANLSSRGATIAYVANRSREAAQELARRFGGEPIGLDELGAHLIDVDVVLASTSSPEPVVRASEVPARRRKPLFFIDIAVPRDVDPAVHELDGCYLYDIDDLEAVVAETLAGRRTEAARAEQLVAEEAERFREWEAALDVVPAIASLRAHAEEIRAAELAKLGARHDEFACYDVEVCLDCRWNHLRRSSMHGRSHAS